MTAGEAKTVLAIALGATVAREMDADALRFLRSHLLPLPYGPTATRVHAFVASHKWCSCLAELLDACGIPESCRGDLVRAVREGGQLVRDLRSMTGWSYLPAGAEPPRGAVEAAAVASGALPPAAPPRALPSPEVVRGVVRDRDRRIVALAGAKRVQPIDRPRAPARQVEAELAAFDARYRAQESAAGAPAGGER